MKKRNLIGIVITVLLIIACATACAEPIHYEAWRLDINELKVELNGQAFPLNPTVRLSVGLADAADGLWAEAAIDTNDVPAITLQMEYANGTLTYSAVNTESYVVMERADELLDRYAQIYGLEAGFKPKDFISTLYGLLSQPQMLEQALLALSPDMLQIAHRSEGAFDFALSLDGASVSGVVEVSKRSDAAIPFSFAEKTPVSFSVQNGFMGGWGFDVPMMAGSMLLAREPSVAALLSQLNVSPQK